MKVDEGTLLTKEEATVKQFFFILATFLVLIAIPSQSADKFNDDRKWMVKTQIDAEGITDGRIGVKNRSVLEAMRRVLRHEFVPDRYKSQSYVDMPLPIGYDQTISQPYIVAYMTELLDPKKEHKVLEVGTGSGYQAAVLAELVKHVYTIEIIKELGESAEERLKRLEYKNVTVKIGDGYFGWEEHAPYDAIIVTAAPDHIPPLLLHQLKPGGKLVIPVGGRFRVQNLTLVQKTEAGSVMTRQVMPVVFVPLTGKH